ncbi:MAG TPA: hypothetical protein VFU90_03535 [Candidatus Tumulicola sp.]|nr:hypothetical protein [Candidatus Tumulicola sp.]HSC31333.1 hypothetical protein [Gemmatimonadaceae bacterium]
MAPRIFVLAVVICIVGLAFAAYLLDVPPLWIAIAVALVVVRAAFSIWRRARRERIENR